MSNKKPITLTRQIDADMVCSTCSNKAVIIIKKVYYCAECGLLKQMKGHTDEYISFTRRTKDMCWVSLW